MSIKTKVWKRRSKHTLHPPPLVSYAVYGPFISQCYYVPMTEAVKFLEVFLKLTVNAANVAVLYVDVLQTLIRLLLYLASMYKLLPDASFNSTVYLT